MMRIILISLVILYNSASVFSDSQKKSKGENSSCLVFYSRDTGKVRVARGEAEEESLDVVTQPSLDDFKKLVDDLFVSYYSPEYPKTLDEIVAAIKQPLQHKDPLPIKAALTRILLNEQNQQKSYAFELYLAQELLKVPQKMRYEIQEGLIPIDYALARAAILMFRDLSLSPEQIRLFLEKEKDLGLVLAIGTAAPMQGKIRTALQGYLKESAQNPEESRQFTQILTGEKTLKGFLYSEDSDKFDKAIKLTLFGVHIELVHNIVQSSKKRLGLKILYPAEDVIILTEIESTEEIQKLDKLPPHELKRRFKKAFVYLKDFPPSMGTHQ